MIKSAFLIIKNGSRTKIDKRQDTSKYPADVFYIAKFLYDTLVPFHS